MGWRLFPLRFDAKAIGPACTATGDFINQSRLQWPESN